MSTSVYNFPDRDLRNLDEIIKALKKGGQILINYNGLTGDLLEIADAEIRGAAYVLGMEWKYMEGSNVIIVSEKNSTGGNASSMSNDMKGGGFF